MIKFYNKTTDNMTNKQKFDYIKNHFSYDVLSSWNQAKSIANNVKIYNLPISNDEKEKLYNILFDEYLCNDFFNMLNPFIKEAETDFNGRIFFNGRSGGYIVIADSKYNQSILNQGGGDSAADFDNLDDFLEYNNKSTLYEQFKIVQGFDSFCDGLLMEVCNILHNTEIDETEIITTKTIKNLIIKGE